MKKRVLFIILTFIIIMPLSVKAKSCTACNLEKDVTSKVACLRECTGTTVSSSTTTTSTVGQKCSNCEKIPSSADRSACLKNCVDDTSSSSSSSSTSSSSTTSTSTTTSTSSNSGTSAISSVASQLAEQGKEYQTSYNEYQDLVSTCASMSGSNSACTASPYCYPKPDGTCVPKSTNITSTSSNTTDTTETTGDHTFSVDDTIKACGIDMPANLPGFTSKVYDIVKIGVPIVIIVLGMFDFMKATMAASEDKAKKNKEMFIRRLIAGVMVFFIMVLVEFVFNHIDISEKNGMISCMKCILSNNSCGDTSSGTSLSKTCSDYSESDCPNMIGKGTVYIMCAPHDGKCVLDCDRLSQSQCSSHQDICKYDNGGCAFR